MARAKSQRADEDALDPVEAADVEHVDDADEGLLELDPEADLDEDEDDEDDEDDDTDTDETEDSVVLDDEDEDDTSLAIAVVPDAAFDEDENEVVAVVIDDDEGDEIEGVRAGEFVCRRCYMAKRETQLADTERLLCRDCV